MSMKYTLLELVQQILRSMKSDEVDSYSDTAESEAVAHIIKENFFNITGMLDLPEHYDFFELEATSASTPVIMTKPTAVIDIDWIKYNRISDDETDPNFIQVQYVPVNQFINMQDSLNIDESWVETFDLTIGTASITMKYRNDGPPVYFTTANDYQVLFDSYDVDEDANLQKTKTQCYGLLEPTFTLSDNATPDLDHRQFQLLLNASKAQCFTELKQVQNPDAERKAKHNWMNTQRTKQDVVRPYPEFKRAPNYGRK